MRVGIEKISLYAGQFYLDMAELAQVRGYDQGYIASRLMCERRSVYPPFEDAVTLAVNAAKRLLSADDFEDIELLMVGTESAVDFGKPISTWVHRFCNLKANCRNFEVKHACYGSTGALKMAASWVAAFPSKKALVISSDLSRRFVNSVHEPLGGGCAVAMLVSANPQVLELELDKTGYWTEEIYDTFRPTSSTEIITGQISMYSYLDALEGAYEHYEQLVGQVDYDADFKKHIYHAPFPGMTFQAHRTMLSRFKRTSKAAATLSWKLKVEEGLSFAKHVGTCYGASNFVSLLSLLNSATDLKRGDKISLFAYGSGCQGEFYHGIIGPAAIELVCSAGIEPYLKQRQRLSVEEYEANELMRERYIDAANYEPQGTSGSNVAYKPYKDRGLLVLKQVEEYQRKYGWS